MDAFNRNSGWIGRVRAELRRDKKKTAILAALLIVAGVMGGRLVVGNAPAPAPAAPALVPDRGPAGTDRAGPGAWSSADLTSREARREAYVAHMDRTISRNIFKANLNLFPASQDLPEVVATSQPAAPGLLELLAERLAEQQAAQNRRAEQVNRLRAEAQALALQSTVLGATPGASTAMINGQILRAGDAVSGFVLKDIAAGNCVVSKDGVDVRLEMRN